MNKKLLAVAVVGALASPAAFAQGTPTTLYGIFDLGYQNATADITGGKNQNKNFIQQGMSDPSRFGIKGSEDLEGGMYAMYGFEFNMPLDTGGSAAGANSADALNISRLAFVGLGSKQWGELTLGRQYTHLFHTFAVGSAHAYGTFASAYGQSFTPTRASNSVKYSSPVFNGFSVGVIWSPSAVVPNAGLPAFAAVSTTAEPTNTTEKTNYYDAALRWTPGPFGAAIGYGKLKDENPTAGAGTSDAKVTELSANWDNKAFGIYGNFQQGKVTQPGLSEVKADNYSLSGVARFGGRHEIYAVVGQVKNKSTVGNGDKASTYGIVYQNRMSKRTYIYTGYGSTSNDPTLAFKPTALAVSPRLGGDAKGFQLGISHSF